MSQLLRLGIAFIGLLLITVFVYKVVTRDTETEGFATGKCGANPDAVFDSSAKIQTGPLANCSIGSKAFYTALAKAKGTQVVDGKLYRFTLPGGVDPVKNIVPETRAYIVALKKQGTAALDPSNWALIQATGSLAPGPGSTGAKLPAPANTSVTPNTVPGSTTANSKDGLANIKDLIAFRDTLKTFNQLYERNIVKASASTELQYLHANAISYNVKIQAQIDTGSIVDSQKFISTERAKYEKVIVNLRQGVFPKPPGKKPTQKAQDKKELTLADLDEAVLRAKAEKKRIDNLRSTATDLKKRSMTLDMVILDVQEITGKIRRGEMKISQIPFTKAQLNRFLMEVKAPKSTIKPLPGLKKAQPKPAAQTKAQQQKQLAGAPGTYPLPSSAAALGALNQFRSAVRDLSWDIYVGYDPNTTLHRQTLDRLAYITNQIESGKVKGPALKALILELEALKTKTPKHDHQYRHKHNLSPYESFAQPPAAAMTGEPVINNQVPVKQELLQNLPQTGSSDWRIRPGYEPTTENIMNRASLSSFDESKVGTPDYKARAKFLCSQIRDAGLGDPKEFGCIGNPEQDVRPEYSWRGNYKMVCSRLGHMWGGWYPEMFGCPKEDLAQTQTPVIHLMK